MIKEIFPYFVFRKDEDPPFYVAEIFQATAPRKNAIQPRIKEYIHFFTQEKWLQHEPLPNILFICPNNKKKDVIQKDTQQILVEEDVPDHSIYIATQEQVKEFGITGDIWVQVKEE